MDIRNETTQIVFLNIFLMSTCLVAVGYKYYIEINTHRSFKFSLNNPYNSATQETSLDVYKNLIDITNFTFLNNPQPCREYPAGLLLMILVSSQPTNFFNRIAIRRTWGVATDSSKTVFLLGETKDLSVRHRLQQESDQYGDIVQGNFADSYRNLTYKHVMALKWIAHHCPTAKYILKTDDDVVVNAREMRRFLGKELSPWGVKGLMACQIIQHAVAQRSNKSKWMVTMAEYGSFNYPTYCAGWAILYSQDVIVRLLEASQEVPYFWIEDVFVTGVLSRKAHVGTTSIENFILCWEQQLALLNRTLKYLGPIFLLGPSEIDVPEMVLLWNSIIRQNTDWRPSWSRSDLVKKKLVDYLFTESSSDDQQPELTVISICFGLIYACIATES